MLLSVLFRSPYMRVVESKARRLAGELPTPMSALTSTAAKNLPAPNTSPTRKFFFVDHQTVHDTIFFSYNPSWNETKFIVVNNLHETLNLATMDFNDHRKDFEIGTTTFDLGRLIENPTHENLTEKILKEGKDKGDLRFDMCVLSYSSGCSYIDVPA